MFCPRCGTENDAGNRFCVSCGFELANVSTRDPTAQMSLRQRLQHLVGTSRRARLLSIATVAALVVALGAFIALKPSEESIAMDSYLRALDSSCSAEKARVSRLELETLGRRPADVEEFASVLVTIVAEWHFALQATPPPAIHFEAVKALESAMLDTLIEAGALARVTREGRPASAVNAQAQAVDRATVGVDRAIQNLGLERCAKAGVGPSVQG